MPTLTAGNTVSVVISGDQTVAISVNHNNSGRFQFIPTNGEAVQGNTGTSRTFGPLPTSVTYGPFGVAGTLTIYADVGTVTYTVNDTFFPNNVGIGTSSPTNFANYTGVTCSNTNGGFIELKSTSATITTYVDSDAGVGRGTAGTRTNHPFAFVTNSVERMRLDASGNLGLGVTPSTLWGPNHRVLDLAGASTAHVVAQANGLSVGGNYYVTSGGIATYQTTGQNATRYWQTTSGQHEWYTAASGTAGNAITFTQAMTLDASGNLGVGATSANSRLQVTNNTDNIYQIRTTNNSAGTAARSAVLFVNDTGDAGFVGAHGSGTAAGIGFPNATVLQSNLSAGVAVVSSNASGGIVFYTGGTGSANERMRITSGGNIIESQPAESAQNASVTLTVANLQAGIITSNAAVTLTLPTGTSLEGYATNMVANSSFDVVFIATTANAITVAANGNTTVGNLTVAGNTSGVFRFRKTATNTFTVYRLM